MVNLDWNNVMSFSRTDVTEQDKEDFYNVLLLYEMESDLSISQMHTLFGVTQEILKFKGEQVESLLGEIDNLAAHQGEEEVHKQNLIDEIQILQSKLAQTTKMESFTGSNMDEIREELVKIEMRNEQLMMELQAKERDLLSEKKEVEKFASQVMSLEREKGELRGELAALQRESIEQQESRLHSESVDVSVEKHRELIESLRLKNQHITQLLTDIEGLEKENSELKGIVGNVQEELKNATENITRLTGEQTNLGHFLNEQQEKLTAVEEQNEALRKQVIEMVADKNNRDEQLDQLSIALDSRLAQWQELLIQKDSELMEAKKRLAELSLHNRNILLDSSKADVVNITQTLEMREQEIEELQKQLSVAMEDIKRNNSLIRQYKAQAKARMNKNGESSIVKQVKRELLQAQDRLTLLEAKVKDAEEDARAKAAEMVEMVIQLREYETGVYGLPEAMEKIKTLQKQKSVRDKHIQQLIQAGNQLQADANHLEEENLSLRAQLGIDVDEVVRVDGILAQHLANQEKLAEVSQQLEAAQEMQIELRLQNRKLKKVVAQLKNQIQQLGFVPEVFSSDEEMHQKKELNKGFEITEEIKAVLMKEAEELESKLQDVIDENEALRKGMHEILDSVRNQDGSSTVHIESTCLERLLEALDSRHISGWYHPAMRLQAQLNTLEGSNATLREQLRQSRQQTSEMTQQLQTALIQFEQLQCDLAASQTKFSQSRPFELTKNGNEPVELSEKCLDNVPNNSKSNAEEFEKTVEKLKEENAKLASKLEEIQEATDESKELYETDRESWQNVRTGLQKEIDSLRENVAVFSAENYELKSQWEHILKEPNIMNNAVAENALRMAALAGENEKLKRKCEVVCEVENRLKINCDNLKDELRNLESSAEQKEGELTRENIKLLAELRLTQTVKEEYVSISSVEEVRQQLNKMTVKYRELIDKQLILDTSKEDLITRLQTEIKTLELQLTEIKMGNSEIKEYTSATSQVSDTTKQLVTNIDQSNIAKQTIEHAEKMNVLMKDQLSVSETRCKQLEKDISAMIQHNLSAQLIEAELRDQLVESVPYMEVVKIKSKLANTERQLSEAKAENLKLQEQVDIVERQVEAWEQVRRYHDFQHDSLQRQVLELTAVSEDKATIGRLSRELMRAQESELTLSKEISKLQDKLKEMESLKLSSETQLKTFEEQFNISIEQHSAKCRSLIYIIHELHQRYLGNLPLLTAESLASILLYYRLENQHTQELIDLHFSTDKILKLIKTKFDVEDKKTMKKIEDLKLHMRVEVMEAQLAQKQGQLERQEKLIASLQQEFISQDQSWEKKQLLWEQFMLEHLRKDDMHEDVKSIESKDNQPDSPKKNTELELVTIKKPSDPIVDQSDEAKAKVELPKIGETANVVVQKPSIEVTTEDQPLPIVPTSINGLPKNNIKPQESVRDIPAPVNESEEVASLKEQLNQAKAAMNDHSVKLTLNDQEITKLKGAVSVLKEQLLEKEQMVSAKERELTELRVSLPDKQQEKFENESTEILALKTTVTSLQNIVNQKEETIGRYQTLLKECREEHSNTVANLQQELSSLQEALDKQEQAVTKMKSEESLEKGPAIKVILEKYLTRVHHLEDEAAQLKDQASRLSTDLSVSREQVEQWAHTAEERLKTIQEMKQRLENDGSRNEMNTQLAEKREEINRLNQTIRQLKTKLDSKDNLSSSRERLRTELDRCKKRLEIVETQLVESKAEIQRLHQQLTIRARSTPKAESISSAREETLQKRIRSLEEQIAELQEKEEKEKQFRKNKCSEEFEKWEIRKRLQSSNEKLRSQLQEKTSQVEALRANVERLKETIVRLERERNSLESKLKSAKGTAVTQTLVEQLEKDRARLQEELRAVRKSSELVAGSSSLSQVVEAQERRIAALRIAQKGDCALAEEVERLQERKSQLQKSNLRLEAENLELKLKLEKNRSSEFSPRDSLDLIPESDISDRDISVKNSQKKRRGDMERAVVVLKRVVEKLQAENKKLHAAKVDQVHDKGYVEKLQIELQRSQENYLDAVDKITSLEMDLKEAKSKLTYQRKGDAVTDDELAAVKAQLAQKCQLLSKIKVMMQMAVVREKALKEQVLDLQRLVPPEMLRGTYHDVNR